jgi:ubiquinone/menaquinone biosynthesis C-methylase UbiE
LRICDDAKHKVAITTNTKLNLHSTRLPDLGIEGATARWYNNNTRKSRLTEMEEYAKKYLHDGYSVLEVAPGPGYLAIELAKLGICNKIAGLDISKAFVEIAKRNAKEAVVIEVVEFRHGNVADMHFPDNSFDFIICTAAFKNFKERLRALNQMCRVLKSGGNALIVDMNRDASNQQIEDYIKSIEAKDIGKLFMRLIFKYFLRNGAYTKDDFTSLISKTAFKQHDIREKGMGFYIHLTK